MRRRKRNVSRYAPVRTCWPLSTRSPVAGSTKADARPPNDGRASSTRTRNPRSASAVAALNPEKPPPMTMTSCVNLQTAFVGLVEQCFHPQPQSDDSALRARHADARAENVVSAPLDAAQDLEIDAAHDLSRDQAASIL